MAKVYSENCPNYDSMNSYGGTALRGYLKKLFFVAATLVFIFQARTSQLAFIVLNAANLGPGRLPSDWQVKVNHGKPEFEICSGEPAPCLHLKSFKASYALQRDV